ncbi:alpha/beta hydrolase [Leifsonia poae]|uniref:alpha/beta hydrolase n=1 Tax=Leifsonia poae TaxID=110933 RepID=UPI003D678ED8
MWDGLLNLDVLEGPLITIVFVLGLAGLVVLLARRPDKRRLLTLAVAVVTGGAAAITLWLICVRWLDLFGGSPGMGSYLWVAATCIAVSVAVVSFRGVRWWRKAVASGAIVVFLMCGVLGVNAVFGVNRTVGNLVNIVVSKPIRLAPLTSNGEADRPDTPLWSRWKPPAGMPKQGTTGTVTIPPTVSGFSARAAGIYLPPAARTSDPPVLPVVVMLMGQPGNPDPAPIASVLNRFAEQHEGLAPIVVVPDQLGPGINDTGCVDSDRYGKVYTYLTQDVTAWITAHLNVTKDHQYWTVAGYSNGGQCAVSLGIKRPDLYRVIIDVSGEEFPGASNPAYALNDLFKNSQSAYDAEKPINLLAQRGPLNSTAVFTASKDDTHYMQVAQKLTQAAKNSGMNAELRLLDHAGHGADALEGGLGDGFAVAYPLLGLSAPGHRASGPKG